MKLIYRGAEAELWKTNYLGFPCIEKRRIKKEYKIPEIDEKIRTERIKIECNLIKKARKAVNTPYIFDVDLDKKSIFMEYIKGRRVKEIFLKRQKIAEISKKIGKCVASLHGINFIHNDLTTSNMILKNGRIYFIDFGLGCKSKKIEDKAVDLVVFKKMLKSTHYKYFDLIWKNFLAGYKLGKKDLKKIEEIEKRARYAER